jgi:trehalose 6-phosphate phosphatase
VLPPFQNIERCAIFLDFDGTIVEIEEHPEAVRMDASTVRLLSALHEGANGALAIISGREIAVVDRFLHPLRLPVAGVHGMQRRDAYGELHTRAAFDLKPTIIVLEKRFADAQGVVIERKRGAIAMHYRLRPDLEDECRKAAEEIVEINPKLRLLRGKMVFEIAQSACDKGGAISAFLSEPPFKGRIPLFAGDDLTDEHGFLVVNARGGVSIKIGNEKSAAKYSAANVGDLKNWLSACVFERFKEHAG